LSEKEEGWMKLDEQGPLQQKHMGQLLTPQELYSTLTKGKSKKWEEKLLSGLVPEPDLNQELWTLR